MYTRRALDNTIIVFQVNENYVRENWSTQLEQRINIFNGNRCLWKKTTAHIRWIQRIIIFFLSARTQQEHMIRHERFFAVSKYRRRRISCEI